MCRVLLFAPIAVVTFAVGLLMSPYDPDAGARGVFRRIGTALSTARSSPIRVNEFSGRWGISGDTAIEIRDGYIVDVRDGKIYAFGVTHRFTYPKGGDKGLLIEIYGAEARSSLGRFVYLGLNGKQLDYFSYNSWEDYYKGQPSLTTSYTRTF